MTGPIPSSGGEVAADPIELTNLAATYLDQSQALGDALRGAAMATPARADFGTVPAAELLHDISDTVSEQAELAVGRLVEVLEGDADRLYQLAFVYHAANLQAAAQTPMRGGPVP
ncbi:MAG: hypothetical protein IRY85_11525 [Micromonosporaceae bacterium]|nr:hypothetical protein [Micromonosporaceae bacterium]